MDSWFSVASCDDSQACIKRHSESLSSTWPESQLKLKRTSVYPSLPLFVTPLTLRDVCRMDSRNLAIVFGGVVFGEDEIPRGGAELLNVGNARDTVMEDMINYGMSNPPFTILRSTNPASSPAIIRRTRSGRKLPRLEHILPLNDTNSS